MIHFHNLTTSLTKNLLIHKHTAKLNFIAQRFLESLKKRLEEKIVCERKIIGDFRKKNAKEVMGQVTLTQIYGGMRGIPAIVWETSLLDAEEGIRFRGYTIKEIREKLPRAPKGCEPLPEGIFWLMLTGDIPTEEQVRELSCDWARRGKLPDYAKCMLDALPKDLHPMAQFSMAITILTKDSQFVKAYQKGGLKRLDYWKVFYEDCMNLLGNITIIAAMIYNNCFKGGQGKYDIDPSLDWSANYVKMMGYDKKEFTELIRLYLTIHADHEGGNVSAHTTHLVGSALSDAYLSFASGLNGLAGPLHGLANQEVVIWIRNMQKELGENPEESKITEYVDKTLKSGQVVPGYGHAVLRKTDPRFTVQHEFALEHLPDDPTFQLIDKIFKVVPKILQGLGKVQNPWPNVDAHSGALLQYYGMREMTYYTVMFGVSRALGVMAQLIWSRAFALPIERPKSFTSQYLIDMMEKRKKTKKDC